MKTFIALFLFSFLFSSFCFASFNEELIATPVGYLPKECVHEVPSDAHVKDDINGAQVFSAEGKLIKTLPLCSHSLFQRKPASTQSFPQNYDGWLAYTSYEYTNGFDSFLGYFSVPDEPKSDPQVLYVFTGLQNVNWIPIVDPPPRVFDIIQPVLQYPASSGRGWSVKSWYVTLSSGTVYGNEVDLDVGDNIFGNMTRVSGDTWFIGGTSSNTGKAATLTVTRTPLASQPWAYTTVECYGCQGCSTLPTQPILFTKMQLISQGSTITPTWSVYQSPNPICNTSATVQSPAQVTMNFNFH